MKDYKTITREKVDADPGAARYMSETHLLEDWSDKLLDLVLNGPTLNGFRKDEIRAALRQTYAALKQYEQIGPMASPYMNDPSAIVARAFAELYPGIDYHAQFVPGLCDESGNRAFGLTIFPDDGSAPIVCCSCRRGRISRIRSATTGSPPPAPSAGPSAGRPRSTGRRSLPSPDFGPSVPTAACVAPPASASSTSAAKRRKKTMNENRNNSGTAGGIGFCGLLTIAFIILKLTGVISWSWLWVLAPIWIPAAIVIAVLLVVLIVVLVKEGVKQTEERQRRGERSRAEEAHRLPQAGRKEGWEQMMDERERRDIMLRAIHRYGEAAQIDMAVEEMAELTKALCKVKRAAPGATTTAAIANVIEEIADVQIMLDQLRLIFARSTDEVEEDKLRRLLARINSWKESKLRRWMCEQEREAADEVLRIAKEEGGAPDE